MPKEPQSDAGSPLRTSKGREVIQVKTNKGLVPFSVKRKNIRMQGGGMMKGVKVKSRGKTR